VNETGKPPIRHGVAELKPTSEFEAKRGSRAHTSGQGGGRLRGKQPKLSPTGLFGAIPIVGKVVRAQPGTVTLKVPPREVISKDNIPRPRQGRRPAIVAYFRIVHPDKAIIQIEDSAIATLQIAQTTLRSVLGRHVLDEPLGEREQVKAILQHNIEEATSPWGIKVSIVDVNDVEIPGGIQRAMARQAESERERRAKVIDAEVEFQAPSG
jgi:regulator of protease activity HflC (stomatin/prohibitin superfamily)